MSTDYYKLYLDDTYTLAKTLVIKSEDTAELVNEYVIKQYGSDSVDESDPASWKYYMNLAGQYHPTDTPMTIKSLDTLETINFTKNNLLVHTATAEAYQYGSRYYRSLVNLYPDQEQLILGILYPSAIDNAVEAENGSILAYPTELVEAQEITLIAELDAWIKRFMVRWHVKAFMTSDSLYPAAQHAILYLNLIPKLLNLRVKRCKTNEAHSFHIRMYLASHGRLDRYLDYMTLKQKLFLYRNIDHIRHHAGKQDTFDWLIEKLLTDRYIPINEYSMRHTSRFSSDFYPEYHFRKKPLNLQFNTPEKTAYTLKEILSKEASDVIGNPNYSDDYFDAIDAQFKNSTSSVVQTKLLESSVVDYTDAVPHKLQDILFNYWGYLSSTGYYPVLINFKDPRSGESKPLMAEDAFIYSLYITLKYLGVTLTSIPTYHATYLTKLVKPTRSELTRFVDRSIIKDHVIADWLLENQPNISRCFSKSAFYTLCKQYYDIGVQQWYLVSRTEHLYERALVQEMINQFYCIRGLTFSSSGMSTSDWMRSVGLEEIDYTQNECQELISNLFYSATGYSVNPTELIGNIQKNMISIMKQLSSYSIQIVSDASDSGIILANWAAVRTGDLQDTQLTLEYVPINIDTISLQGESSDYFAVDATPSEARDLIEDIISDYFEFRQSTLCQLEDVPLAVYQLEINTNVQRVYYDEYDPAISQLSNFVGYEYFVNLTDQEKRDLVDIYGPDLDQDYAKPSAPVNASIVSNVYLLDTAIPLTITTFNIQ